MICKFMKKNSWTCFSDGQQKVYLWTRKVPVKNVILEFQLIVFFEVDMETVK